MSSLRMPPHVQVEWTLCGSHTLAVLWRHLQDICKANDGHLVHRDNISSKQDLEIGGFDKDIVGEKDEEQAVHHLFCP